MSTCLFCRIVQEEIPADIVHRDEQLTAFRDINPQAPVHVLIIPNEHVESVGELSEGHDQIAGRALRLAAAIARQEGVAAEGYRVVANIGKNGGQQVAHLHFHLLGGRPMGWPPG